MCNYARVNETPLPKGNRNLCASSGIGKALWNERRDRVPYEMNDSMVLGLF